MPNPWVILAIVLAFIGVATGAYLKGGRDAVNREAAAAAREEKIAQVAYENGQRGAAVAISGIKVINKTFRTELEKETIRDPVYSNCFMSDSAFSLLNRHLEGPPAEPAGSSKLPVDTGSPP